MVVLGIHILKKDDPVFVVLVWAMLLFHDQRTSAGYALEADVAMVEIRAGHTDRDVHLVVEELEGRDGPLRDERGAVAEG